MKAIYLLPIALLFYCNSINAQCSSTAYTNGTIFSSDNNGGILNFDFDNSNNVHWSDDVMSQASSLIGLLAGNTYYLKVTGFNFALPTYATICGIRVQVERKAFGLGLGGISDHHVRIIKNGAIVGDDNASGSSWSTSETTANYGSTSDDWHAGLTVADINSSNFGIGISVHLAGIQNLKS